MSSERYFHTNYYVISSAGNVHELSINSSDPRYVSHNEDTVSVLETDNEEYEYTATYPREFDVARLERILAYQRDIARYQRDLAIFKESTDYNHYWQLLKENKSYG